MRHIFRILLLFGLGALPLRSQAQTSAAFYTFNAPLRLPGATPLLAQSNGQALDHRFFFVLGCFSIGFTPTAGNSAQWADNWTTVSIADYNPSFQRYANTASTTTNAGVFSTANRAWIWAFSAVGARREMVLFGRNTWKWQTPGSLISSAWSLAAADEAILGQVNTGSASLSTTSSSVAVPTIPYSFWRQANFSAADSPTDPRRLPDADFDGDGKSNLLEYILGTPATVAESLYPAPTLHGTAAGWHLALEWDLPAHTLASYAVELSTGLQFWQSSGITILENNRTRYRAYATAPMQPANPMQFLRLRATVP